MFEKYFREFKNAKNPVLFILKMYISCIYFAFSFHLIFFVLYL